MQNDTLDTALLKTQDFAARFPAIATMVAKQTNAQVDTPTALMSDSGQENLNKLAQGNQEDFDALLNFELPNTAGQSQESATNSLFGAAEQNVRAGITAKSSALQKLNIAQEDLDRMSQFNRASYTKKRLKEIDPVSDLDNDISELRQQMFLEDIQLDADPNMEQYSPEQRSQIRAATQQKYITAISELSNQRKSRLAAAQNQIDEEISAQDDQINASIARVNALKRTVDSINEIGKDNEALISLRMDLLKEQERLKKLRKGAGGKAGTAYSTQKERARIQLRQQFIDKNGRDPDNEEEQAIDHIVENSFLQIVGDVSITGRMGEENMLVDTSQIRLPEITNRKFSDPTDQLIEDAIKKARNESVQ